MVNERAEPRCYVRCAEDGNERPLDGQPPEPSQFWVTERFKEALERTPSFYRAEPIDPAVRAERRSPDGMFNVKKPGSAEEDHFLRLFRIVEPGR